MFDKIFQSAKKHWAALILAVIIGFIIIGPNLIFTRQATYDGIPIIQADFESYYLTRINAAYRGCLLTCNPFVKEYGDQFPFFDPSLSEFILAIPGIIFNIPVLELKMVYEFLLPFILSLLVYWLTYRLTNRQSLSLAGTACILVGFNLINSVDLISFQEIWSVLTLEHGADTNSMIYARPVNPAFSSILFVIALHIIYSCWQNPAKRYFILLGLIYGFSFYVYFYTYTFLTTIILSAVFISLLTKKYDHAFRFSLSLIAGLALGSPILTEIWSLVHHPLYINLPRIGIIESHTPIFDINGLLLLALPILVIVLYKRRFSSIPSGLWFITIFPLASILAKNQHVLTGSIIQYFHYDQYFMTPIMILSVCLFVSLSDFSSRNKTKFRIACLLIVVFCLFNAIQIQRYIYRLEYDYTVNIQKYSPVLSYIKHNIPAGSVIIAPSLLDRLVAIETHIYSLWLPTYSEYYLFTTERKNDGLTALSSATNFKIILAKYSISYIIVDNKSGTENFNLKPYIKSTVYSDKFFTVYSLKL